MVEESNGVPVPILVQCFQQLSSAASKADPIDICTTAEHLLRQETDAGQYWAITDSVIKAVQSISEDEKLSMIQRILPASVQQCSAEKIMLVRCIISAMHISRKHEVATSGTGSVSVLVRLLELLNACSEYDIHQQLVACVTAVLREQVCVTRPACYDDLLTTYPAQRCHAIHCRDDYCYSDHTRVPLVTDQERQTSVTHVRGPLYNHSKPFAIPSRQSGWPFPSPGSVDAEASCLSLLA